MLRTREANQYVTALKCVVKRRRSRRWEEARSRELAVTSQRSTKRFSTRRKTRSRTRTRTRSEILLRKIYEKPSIYILMRRSETWRPDQRTGDLIGDLIRDLIRDLIGDRIRDLI